MKLSFNKKNTQLFWTVPKNIRVVNPAGIPIGETRPDGRLALVISQSPVPSHHPTPPVC